MNESLEDFFKEEMEISRYRLDLLLAVKNRDYKDRLIKMEEDFLKFPFNELPIKSLDEARSAVHLFRSDRSLFNKRFSVSEDCKPLRPTTFEIKKINDRILFFENLYRWILDEKIHSINIIDDDYFREKYNLKNKIKSLEDIIKNEGAISSKERGRIQIILCCIARFLYNEIKNIRSILSEKELSRNQTMLLRGRLDNIFVNYNSYIYQYYNDSIDQVFRVTDGGMGSNQYVLSIYPLSNLADKIISPSISRSDIKGISIFSKTGKPIRKKYAERAYCINTGVSRVGNESLNLLFFDAYSERGSHITPVIIPAFFNLKVGRSNYVKAIPMVPMWEIDSDSCESGLKEELKHLFSNELFLSDEWKANEPALDRVDRPKVLIDKEKSKILVAATRTESDRINEAKKYIYLLINSLQEEYQKKFDPVYHECDNSESLERRSKVKQIMGSIFND